MVCRTGFLVITMAGVAALLIHPAGWCKDPPAASAIDFGRDIRPILSNNCFRCHGPDDEKREADLRLDSFAEATRDLGGRLAIKPHHPESSAALQRILSADPEQQMPPAASGLKLSAHEISLLRTWIQQGAEYQQHWAFRSVIRPAVPQIQSSWPRNPIDHFILAKLNEQGILPSPEAERTTLIRRVWLDLLGLPPSVAEVDQFLNDSSNTAYSSMVERALASPHYGERWGRHWLDQARYADTNGYTIDSERSLWPWRDWVIQALNNDLPFDQFTIEQLAGDLLPQPTREQLVATGFHRNTLINEEGGTDPEQFRNEAVVDRVNTTGAVWLGLTLGCAQCHTHKYDPVSQREYYQLFAFFNQGQDVNTASPVLEVPTAEQTVQRNDLEQQIAAAKAGVAEYDAQRRATQAESNPAPVDWLVVHIDQATSIGGALFYPQDDESLLVSADNMVIEKYTLRFRSPVQGLTALRLEALTDPSLPAHGPGRSGNGNFVLTEVSLQSSPASANATGITADPTRATWVYATADHSQRDFAVTDAIDGKPETGWGIGVDSGSLNVNRTATFVMSELPIPAGREVTVELHFGPKPPAQNLGRFRLSVTSASHTQLDVPDARRAELLASQKKFEDARKQLNATIPTTLIMGDLPQPRETHVLVRGDFLRKGAEVEAGVPRVFPELTRTPDDSAPGGSYSRLDLARWLVDRRNPLTARVTVNRIWARYFGRGLVETENDFGLQGTPPSHPELLDWLACEFMEQGWSLKHVHRLIVNSATWRQSSRLRPDLQTSDPLNKLLARQSRLRVDAEVVRDLGLAVSGLLQSRVGGPGVYPPQPEGVYAFTQRNATWPVSQGADRYRRGMYTFFMRSAPYPMLTTFDTPRFDTTCTLRIRSNTPLQSLSMANDPAMMEMARALGERIRNPPPTDPASGVDAADAQAARDANAGDPHKLQYAFRLCFSRPAFEQESARLHSLLQHLRQDFRHEPAEAAKVAGDQISQDTDPVEAAAWTIVARTLLNLDEFIVRE